MDLVSFGQLVQITHEVKNERMIDQGLMLRVAQHGDEKAWKSWVKSLRPQAVTEDQSADFLRDFGGHFKAR